MYRKFEVIAVYVTDGDEPMVDDELTSPVIEATLFEAYHDILFQVWMTEEDVVEV